MKIHLQFEYKEYGKDGKECLVSMYFKAVLGCKDFGISLEINVYNCWNETRSNTSQTLYRRKKLSAQQRPFEKC